jgi:hypothetical protein
MLLYCFNTDGLVPSWTFVAISISSSGAQYHQFRDQGRPWKRASAMKKTEIKAFTKRIAAKIARDGLPSRPLSDADKQRAERLRRKRVEEQGHHRVAMARSARSADGRALSPL